MPGVQKSPTAQNVVQFDEQTASLGVPRLNVNILEASTRMTQPAREERVTLDLTRGHFRGILLGLETAGRSLEKDRSAAAAVAISGIWRRLRGAALIGNNEGDSPSRA